MMPDFGRCSNDYAAYRVDFAAELFSRLHAFGVGMPGQRVLDLGAGTGLFGAHFVTHGCDVTFVDCSHSLLRHADAQQGRRVAAIAERLPLDDTTFDVVSAAQCWHWFDRTVAPREVHRVLRPAGRVAVVYQTHIPMPGSIAEATEHLILKHQPNWRRANSTGINGQVLRDLQSSGFAGIESFSFDVEIEFTREHWRGFVRTLSPVGPSMSSEQLRAFDDQHAELLENWPEPVMITHRVFCATAHPTPTVV